MRRLATALMIVGLAVGAAFMTGASNDKSNGSGKTYKIDFDNAFGLTTGGDLKIGGVRAGKTTAFDLRKIGNGRYVAEVTAQITASGVSGFHRDASCEIRPQSLIGEYYVDCQPGSSPQMLPDGGTVPVKNTVSTIPPDLMQNIMRRPYRERFRLIIAELGTGLAGRPGDLSQVLHRAAPGLRETSKVLQILGRQNQIIQNFIVNSDAVIKQLAAHKIDVANWVHFAGKTAAISATREAALREQWQQFPRFLAELQPTMAQLGALADQQIPLLQQVTQTAPQLKQFFANLGPFSKASQPSIRTLAAASRIGNKAFKDSQRHVQELNAIGVNAPSAAKQTRQFLQSLDDRNRSIEPDARAATLAPPAPDPAAYHNGQGFTGFESLLNYVFWQTLALNPYDQLGHLLRVVLVVNSCSPWETGPVTSSNQALFAQCNSWLGPNQPGVTTPDPTDKQYAALIAKAETQKRTKPVRIGGITLPANTPSPGQDNPSIPKVVLPPAVQQLLKSLPQVQLSTPNVGLPAAGQPQGGPANDKQANKLLDFLLSP